MKRFICKGGRGQDAGLGKDGADGKSLSSISNIFKRKDTGRVNTFTASFAAPCVYATYHWHWIIETEKGKRGVDDWPGNGEDALEPGVPGSGGNGGSWVSNQKQLLTLFSNDAGEAGRMAPSVKGGAAGQPTTSTHYDLTIRFNLTGDTAGGDNTLLRTVNTSAGKGYQAKDSSGGRGKSPAPSTVEVRNAWVHPLQVESVLRYARDAFLAGARAEVSALLKPYERALAAPLPTNIGVRFAAWTTDEEARWNSAQAEVASILHRLQMQLDYFGNPAGYMPLLSLQATMRLYDLETKDALRTLLLTAWAQDKSNAAQSAANAFGSAIDDTNKDTRRVAEQLVQAEAEMAKLDQQLTSLEGRLTTLATNMETLKSELFNEAAADQKKKAFIKASIKMAGAICQCVPIGQPVLGTIGKLADMAADINENGTPDTLSKMGGTIKKARDAANKAKAAKEKAKEKAKGKDAKPKEEASAWAKAGDGLGPALSMAGGAIGALQVSDEEIEVELAKLVAASPRWNALVEQIRVLNKDKAELFPQLSKVLQAIGDGYARLASNADSVVTMQQERNQTLGKLSVEANQVIARMGQAARLSLQRSLYLMVKAYETTVFEPLDVDWSLDEVFDKITKLLKPDEGFDAQTINSYAQVVAPLFEDNKKKIKNSLLKDYGFGDMASSGLEFGFTTQETRELLEQLRLGRRLSVNPLAYGLILPNQERVKAVSFECTNFVFDENGPQPPKSGNAIISLRPDGDGTVRRREHLYAVRSDAPRVWSWTYHFSDRSLTSNVPSLSALDLLNLLLDSDNESIKQKLAAPPAWSELTLKLDFSPPLPPEKRPVLKSLMFVCNVESLPTLDAQRVLDVRAEGASEYVLMTPADLAGRGDGYGDSYRIYNKADKVTMEAPAQVGDRPFSHWDILASESYSKDANSRITLVLDTDTLIYCRYRPVIDSGAAILKRFAQNNGEAMESEAMESEASEGGREAAVAARMTDAPSAAAGTTEANDGILLIRAGADANQPIIGLVAEGEQPVVLEEDAHQGGWMKVAHKGLVGYIAH